MAKKILLSVFSVVGLLMGQSSVAVSPPAPVCSWTCDYTTTCWTCAGTCNACAISMQQDTDYPKTLTQLPINFNYSHADTNTWNNTCSSSMCGTKTCSGTTTDNANQLPLNLKGNGCYATGGPTPGKVLPAKVNCRWQDHYCYQYCAKWESYSCCGSWSYTCH